MAASNAELVHQAEIELDAELERFFCDVAMELCGRFCDDGEDHHQEH